MLQCWEWKLKFRHNLLVEGYAEGIDKIVISLSRKISRMILFLKSKVAAWNRPLVCSANVDIFV